MIPYPSGSLHLGHVRVYCVSDAIARFNRMLGKNVLHPMGWDAFGLPAENAALENKIDPDQWTRENIASMKAQMMNLKLSFDWDREINTCDPDFYKWTQYLFLKLYENGLVYRKKDVVNWDPVDQTVLANEQIDENGRCWRSGALVEKKLLTQWFIKTSKFMKALSDGLDTPAMALYWEGVQKYQKKWLGDCSGYKFDFIIEKNPEMECEFMTIWVKAPEYITKAKFVAVKPQSMWDVESASSNLLPYKVINPFTGTALPVYVTEDVIYPDGAENYLGIPEIIETDKSFAESVGIPTSISQESELSEAESLELREKICAEARNKNIGGYQTGPRDDWLISRQRYWGTPIPLIHCKKCKVQPVPENELPVKLPKVDQVEKGKNHLAELKEWCKTTCPKCKGEAVRETDTMDTFVDSSWYFLRYLEKDAQNAPFSVEKVKKFMPVDLYLGGTEHAVTHLYFARFFNYFLYSLGLLSNKEPFKALLPQGMLKGKTFKSSKTGEYVRSHLVDCKNDKAVHKETGEKLIISWEKMSKSKYNGVDPNDIIAKHGVDTTRLAILFEVGPKNHRNWDEYVFTGITRFQSRLWETVKNLQDLRNQNLKIEDKNQFESQESSLRKKRNYHTRKITKNFSETYNICVGIKSMQGFLNDIRDSSNDVVALGVEYEKSLAALIMFLAPVAPSFASELWAGFLKASNRVCNSDEIKWDVPLLNQSWPVCDEEYLKRIIHEEDEEEIDIKSTGKMFKKGAQRLIKFQKLKKAVKEDMKKVDAR